MGDDIVERLRVSAAVSDPYAVDQADLLAAADEIKRLRSLLAQANDAFDECTGEYSAGLVHGEPWREFRSAGSEAPR